RHRESGLGHVPRSLRLSHSPIAAQNAAGAADRAPALPSAVTPARSTVWARATIRHPTDPPASAVPRHGWRFPRALRSPFAGPVARGDGPEPAGARRGPTGVTRLEAARGSIVGRTSAPLAGALWLRHRLRRRGDRAPGRGGSVPGDAGALPDLRVRGDRGD